MKLARESTVIWVILDVSDRIRSELILVSIAKCISMLSEFHGNVPELMPKFGVGRLVFFLGGSFGGGRLGGVGGLAPGGGGSGRLVGGGRASRVLSLMFFYVY